VSAKTSRPDYFRFLAALAFALDRDAFLGFGGIACGWAIPSESARSISSRSSFLAGRGALALLPGLGSVTGAGARGAPFGARFNFFGFADAHGSLSFAGESPEI
jgi:hypothetical protein